MGTLTTDLLIKAYAKYESRKKNVSGNFRICVCALLMPTSFDDNRTCYSNYFRILNHYFALLYESLGTNFYHRIENICFGLARALPAVYTTIGTEEKLMASACQHSIIPFFFFEREAKRMFSRKYGPKKRKNRIVRHLDK